MAPLTVPNTQGLQSSTFVQPPLDASLSLPALYDWQAEHSPNHPLFVFDDAPGSKRTILWNEAVQGIHRATRFVRKIVGRPFGSNSSGEPPVIAVLATSDAITYLSLIVGAMRTGWVIFPISPRNSPPAVAALLTQTKATHLFVAADTSLQNLATAALAGLSAENAVEKCNMPVFEDFFPTTGFDRSFAPEPIADIDMNAESIIFHSSGTTAFPKPIPFTHRSLVKCAASPCFGEIDFAGSIWGCHSLPMFHGMGMLVVLHVVSTGMIAAVFKPQSPPTVPNPVNVLEGVMTCKADYVFCAPSFMESWSHESDYVEALAKTTKAIIFGGGPLSKDAGDSLASNGVNVVACLASTQTMIINDFLQERTGRDWEYFKISPAREAYFIDNGNNEFEIVIFETDFFRPNVINTVINGRNAYATADLVSPHPTKEGYWKVVGRTDDQIMHSTGEKTNPGPLEGILARDPLVSGAVMFGRGRFNCGVLVQPKEPFAFDPTDSQKLVEFRNIIWPTIERMNAYAPTHSRIFKEMILVASPSKPFSITSKGTLRRQAILDDYDAEIDALYKAVDESAQEDVAGPVDWSLPRAAEFARVIVERTMKKGDGVIPDDADLFEFGLDSLQATWIRNTVLGVLRNSQPSVARNISSTFVYDYPAISRLAKYLSTSVLGTSVDVAGDAEAKRRELQALVTKYTKTFPEFEPGTGAIGNGDVVLLTGGTGSLGSNILAKLVEDPAVRRVYAMSRPSSDGVSGKERHLRAFERESLNVGLLSDAKVSFLEGDPSHADFAIDPKHFEELQSSVTHVIHNGWRVNFNVAVTSFESNIRSVRNFVDFSLGGHGATPARVLFVSSIGVFSNYTSTEPAPEEPLTTSDSAIGTGYSESKWVSEQILQKASEKTPLSSTVVRCGQMTGGPSGAWNTHEWFPSVVKSSIALGKLPDVEGAVSWLTAHDAAGGIVDMLHAHDNILHLIHPRPVSWSSIIASFSTALDLPTVPYAGWLSALENAQSSLYSNSSGTPDSATVEDAFRANPALRLLDFFRAAAAYMGNVQDWEPLGLAKLRCDHAEAASKALREAEQIGEKNVRMWVENWRESGFLPRA